MTTPSSTTSSASVRTYDVQARSTPVFGRVECTVRDDRFLVDGPVGNGCPGERPTPGELMLSAAAACGAEIVQVIARDDGVSLARVEVAVHGMIDRERQARDDVTTFTAIEVTMRLWGPSAAQGAALVAAFQRRCPVYGSLAVASGRIVVRHEVVAA